MASTGVSHALAYAAVSVDDSAELIVAGKTQRKSVLIRNNDGTNTLYIGSDSDVTDADGMPLEPGESVRIDDYNGPVYGIGSAASTDVRYLEVG